MMVTSSRKDSLTYPSVLAVLLPDLVVEGGGGGGAVLGTPQTPGELHARVVPFREPSEQVMLDELVGEH